MPGKFPPGIQELLPSAKPIQGAQPDYLFVAATNEALSRVMITWAPFIDTAYHTSVYRISDYQALDDYLPFFERSMRKVLSFVDLLFLCVRKDVEKTRDADREFLLHLLESRGQDGRITVVDTWNRKKAPGYRKIVDVGG